MWRTSPGSRPSASRLAQYRLVLPQLRCDDEKRRRRPARVRALSGPEAGVDQDVLTAGLDEQAVGDHPVLLEHGPPRPDSSRSAPEDTSFRS